MRVFIPVCMLILLGLCLSGCSNGNGDDPDGGDQQDAGPGTDDGPGADDGGAPADEGDQGTDEGPPADECTGPPGAFELSSPVDGDFDVSTTPTLEWTQSPGAVSYGVEVATDPAFGEYTVVQENTGGDAFLDLSTPLSVGVVYYWRVTAYNDCNETPASNAPFWMSSPYSAGENPLGVAVTSDGARAVVANNVETGTVTLVTLASAATETVTVGAFPRYVALTPDSARALVTEGAPNDVMIIDLTGVGAPRTVLPGCESTTLYGIAVTPDSSSAVMPDFGSSCIWDVLDVIDIAGGSISRTIDLNTSAAAFGVAVTPDGAWALVTRGILGNSVRRVDLASGSVTEIQDTSSSYGVAVTADGLTAVVTSGPMETVKRISLSDDTVAAEIDFESNSHVCNLAISPDGKLAVVAGSFSLGIISLETDTLLATYPTGGRCVAVHPSGKFALLTDNQDLLSVIKLP